MQRLNQLSIPVVFDTVIKYIINSLIIYIIIILMLSLGKNLYSIKTFFNGDLMSDSLSHAITDILSFLVMIEFFRKVIEYFKARRIRLHSMIDPAIIFIVRELIIQLYAHEKMVNITLVGFGILLLCLGEVRSLALLFSPEDGIRVK